MKAELLRWINSEEITLINTVDQQWLISVFERHNGFPKLEQIWNLMDEAWDALKCDPNIIDARIDSFYAHPVWLLNGLFIEQHSQSIENRKFFRDWVVKHEPKRVGELGGGFGSLARAIGSVLPATTIEIIEPHPHPIAISRSDKTKNVKYVPNMVGNYDVLLATDVFEHVHDPLQLVYETSNHLKIGGRYFIANSFFPVIRCHLPQTFHYRHSWDTALHAMGLIPEENIAYGRSYIRFGSLNLDAARLVEMKSRKIWKLTQYLPNRMAQISFKFFSIFIRI